MKGLKGSGARLALGVAVLVVPALLHAQTTPTCNLSSPSVLPQGGCSGTPACSSPAGPDVAVIHATTSPCVTAAPSSGGVDMRGTAWENTCCDFFGKGGCTVDLPPFRYWQFNRYKSANIGCVDTKSVSSFCNGKVDFGQGGANGYWFAFQASWGSNSGTEGQFDSAAPAPAQDRTVLELRYKTPCDATKVGCPETASASHTSWYAIASVNNSAAGYDFDRVNGANGDCGGTPRANMLKPIEVPGVSVTGLTCPGDPAAPVTKGTQNTTSAGFIDLDVSLVNGSPDYFTEAAVKNDAATRLIAGSQLLYVETTKGTAPMSSDYTVGGWKPVLDPANTANAANFIAWGATATTKVSVPKPGAGNVTWLANRLVYSDAGLSPGGSFPSTQNGPLVTSHVSAHCGAITFLVLAVDYEKVDATRGRNGAVTVSWKTAKEINTIGFNVSRMEGTPSAGTGNVPVQLNASSEPVLARGAYNTYTFDDLSADPSKTYTYYVEEVTSDIAGGSVTSVILPAQASTSEVGVSGGRSRKAR